jgi:hypothetical protein
MTVAINPETRVGQLLDAYPGIEDVLIKLAPPFEKLRNPILRKTVAKVATLEQAARIGGIGVRDLVRQLREATGQSGPECAAGSFESESAPSWISGPVRHEISADEMLERGVHPIGRVRECAASLAPGELLRLDSSFRPEPLLETMRKSGFDVFCSESTSGRHHTYLRKP